MTSPTLKQAYYDRYPEFPENECLNLFSQLPKAFSNELKSIEMLHLANGYTAYCILTGLTFVQFSAICPLEFFIIAKNIATI